MKKLIGLIVLAGLVFFIWNAVDSTKPECKAKVGIKNETAEVSIKNCGDQAWSDAEIIVNSAFDGPCLQAAAWQPGETRVLNLREFKGRLNHQAYNPETDRAVKVLIDAKGFQLGIYHN